MSIKVTDRRMFTEDGELREGYEAAEEDDKSPPQEAVPPPVDPSPAPPQPSPSVATGPSHAPAGSESAAGPSPPRPDVDTGEARHPAAQFLEIVGSLVEPATLFLGDAQMPDGKQVEDLERARVYIDLLAVLKEKTQGNLTQEEESVLGEILYRLRMRYVQKRDAGT